MRNVPGHFVKNMSSWRRIAPIVWSRPGDPCIYGIIDADITSGLLYLQRLEAETGLKLTLTHLVTRAIALTFQRHPECNAYVRWGRIYQRRDVDLFVLVATDTDNTRGAADLTGVRLAKADTRTVVSIAREVQQRAGAVRAGKDDDIGPLKTALRRLPYPLARLGLMVSSALQYGLNIDLSGFGLARDTYGGAIISSMGMFGIKYGFAPLVPAMRLSCLIGVGRAEERAVVVDGAVTVRTILPLTATLDHRVIDGYHAGKLAATLTALLSDPEGNGL